MVEQQTLKTLITLVTFGGAAPYASYKFIEWLKVQFPNWTYLGKWFVSWACTLTIAWGAYVIGLAFGYFQSPAVLSWQTIEPWASVLFTIGFGSLTMNQGYHAVKVYLNGPVPTEEQKKALFEEAVEAEVKVRMMDKGMRSDGTPIGGN